MQPDLPENKIQESNNIEFRNHVINPGFTEIFCVISAIPPILALPSWIIILFNENVGIGLGMLIGLFLIPLWLILLLPTIVISWRGLNNVKFMHPKAGKMRKAICITSLTLNISAPFVYFMFGFINLVIHAIAR